MKREWTVRLADSLRVTRDVSPSLSLRITVLEKDSFLNATASVAHQVSTVSMVTLASRSPSVSSVLLKLGSNLLLLYLLNGETLRHAFAVPKYLQSVSFVPQDLDRLLPRLARDDECEQTGDFEAKEIRRSIVHNYAKDLLLLYCVTLASLLLTAVSALLYKSPKSHDSTKPKSIGS